MSQNSTSFKPSTLASNAPHVLLVEDNIVALHFIETITTQAGLRFTSAMDGKHALELAKSHTFDLIITDIELPSMSGYELALAIRQWEKNTVKNPVPIIGLTARREEKNECLQSGMNQLLYKPIDLKSLEELIKQFL